MHAQATSYQLIAKATELLRIPHAELSSQLSTSRSNAGSVHRLQVREKELLEEQAALTAQLDAIKAYVADRDREILTLKDAFRRHKEEFDRRVASLYAEGRE